MWGDESHIKMGDVQFDWNLIHKKWGYMGIKTFVIMMGKLQNKSRKIGIIFQMKRINENNSGNIRSMFSEVNF